MEKTFRPRNNSLLSRLTSKSNDLENERSSVKDALDIEASNKFTRLMATFVPNEIILAKDLEKKIKDQFDAILLFIDISDLTNRYNTFTNAENGGMYAFTILLNEYFNVIISEIYIVEGDVFKISQDTILSLWRIHQGELILNIMPKVINCAFNVKNAVMAMEENAEFKLKMNIVISVGNVIFSILGNELSRHYVIAGQPLLDFKKAQDISLPGDLILSTKAWEYCTPSKYEYVIKDAHNIKIIKILKYNKKLKQRRTTIRPLITNNSNHWDPAMLQKLSELLMKTTMDSTEESTSSEEDQDQEMFSPRTSMLETIKRSIGIQLKIYLIHTVTQQIALNQPLEYLMETRRVTIIYIDIIPSNSNTLEFIYLMDECYLLLHSIIRPFSACMYLTNMYESNILFSIVFGLKELIGIITNNEKMTQNAITCAFKILHALKNNLDIRGVSIGVSTGMAYCGVVGHNTRKEYMIIGTPLTYAKGMMEISNDKISCDYDTIIHSNLSRTAFKSRGIHEIKKIGKCHVYEFLGIPSIQLPPVKTSNLYYRYPILGRSEELEVFNDILDNIGVMDRNYSGILIMGDERSGKSRLLDAYVSIAKNRQINVIQLPLHYSYSEKEFTVIYYIILLILNAEDCKCIKDRERILKKKLSSFLPSNEFCYLNTLMKVSFPLSNEYCAANHSQRYIKMREIFNLILNQSDKMCIFLDDFHYTDSTSWYFVSVALNNINVVIVITTLNPPLNIKSFNIEENLFEDNRLIKIPLEGLENQFLTGFVCQFLNVVAISRNLDTIIKRYSRNDIGWCEVFLSLTLQSNGLTFLTISNNELEKYNLIFPRSYMVRKVPFDLFPEDVIPSSKTNLFPICITNDRYIGFADATLNYNSLKRMIFERMNPYQKEFIKCAAAIGKLFIRGIIQNLTNLTTLNTAETVSELIRIRVVECASIQRHFFYTDDYLHALLIRRKTFSDMHHLVQCNCSNSNNFMIPNFATYSNCKILEFKILSFYKMLYNMLEKNEKDDYWYKTYMIYKRETHKCDECGGSSFLKTFSRNLSNKTIITNALKRAEQNFLKTDNQRTSKSINAVNSEVFLLSFFNHDEENEEVEEDSSDIANVSDHIVYDKYRLNSLRKSFIEPEKITHPFRTFLKEFHSIDYRKCHCYDKINSIYWQLSQHMRQIGSEEDMLEFLIEYSIGLIYIAEPMYALKILEFAEQKNKKLENECRKKEKCNVYSIVNKGIILILMGDANVALGHFSQAKIMYNKAIALRTTIPQSSIAICYVICIESLYLQIGTKFLRYFVNRYRGPTAFDRLELASYLARFSSILMIERKEKLAKSIILQSLRLGFENSGNFLKQAKIYLAAVKVLRRTANFNFIKRLENLMIEIITKKINRFCPEDVMFISEIFMAMYEIRALRGEFEKAIEFGKKILKITCAMKFIHVKLALLPSFIEIMVWTKHISEAVDLINELYYISDEDIDNSAITWYYALCLELLLEAGIFLESYESCFQYAKTIVARDTKACVSRDPICLTRLLSGLWIWQLRMGYNIDESFEITIDTYTTQVEHDNFSAIVSCSQGLEYYLLVLIRCINLKKASEYTEVLDGVYKITKTLSRISKRAPFIKPFFYFYKSHINIIRSKSLQKNFNLNKAEKWSRLQNNKFIIARIIQSKRAMKICNVREYWIENVAYMNNIHWQDIEKYDLNSWAAILYPLPIPNTCL